MMQTDVKMMQKAARREFWLARRILAGQESTLAVQESTLANQEGILAGQESILAGQGAFWLARREQPTAVEGARATGTRLRVCNCRQKHAQGPRASNRRREGFGRVGADLGVAKV